MVDLIALLENAARLLEFFGVAVIFVAVFYSLVRAGFDLKLSASECYSLLRQRMGRGILLGLEILIAADIVATVITRPSLETGAPRRYPREPPSPGTILSLSIEVEIDGRWPWQRKQKS